MSLILAGAFAASAANLSAADVARAFMPNPYPTWALRKKLMAALVADLWVDPHGKVLSCTPIGPDAPEALAREVCRSATDKVIQPARLSSGANTYSYVRTLNIFVIPGAPGSDAILSTKLAPDLIMQVKPLPGRSGNIRGAVTLAVGTDGAIVECLPYLTPGDGTQDGLPQDICKMRDILRQPVKADASGNPVPYVTIVRIQLTTVP